MTERPTACLVLADGTVFYGEGYGDTGQTDDELKINTAMTRKKDKISEPSYKKQH